MKGVIAGIIAGIAGAALWAVIAAVTGFEIGWLAWGIGAAVGAGVAWGAEGSPVTGVVAVVIAVLAIVAGKFITVEIVLAKEVGAASEEVITLLDNDDFLTSHLADEIVSEYIDSGKSINWPAGVDPDEAALPSEFPPEIWSEAEQRLVAMSETEKDEFKGNLAEQIQQDMDDFADSIKTAGFLASFSIMDIVFFLLAIGTAYKIGAREDYTS